MKVLGKRCVSGIDPEGVQTMAEPRAHGKEDDEAAMVALDDLLAAERILDAVVERERKVRAAEVSDDAEVRQACPHAS